MNKSITAIIIITIIIVGVILLTNRGGNVASTLTPPPPPPKAVEPPPSEKPKTPALNTGFYGTDLAKIPSDAIVIKITDKGFEPAKITAKKGVTVYFANEDSKAHWPATAIHPTHKVYPNSDIKNCKTDKARNMFDACRGIPKGNFYAFTFGESGIWKFHDHLNTSSTGAITIQ